ncbi:Deacetoxyvindoline 4-hydroxylase isoform B [Glycine soja]|uniref:Deacetoxyvindoline 4-hydroxylase isoform B n=1 Tax=Glycine soja TaxID=3848 RepID=A0A445JFR9_GLYSO|nr:Deacetoxyvindoline 4-hydroxylase isoform B [Glycine soja]
MAATNTDKLEAGIVSSYDRKSELMALDDSNAGVQGLCIKFKDQHPHNRLTGIHDDPILKDDVEGKVRYACEKWGFFHLINHGIPTHVLDEMIRGTCRFHQQDAAVRKVYYTRDLSRKVAYLFNYTLYEDPSADWRDTLAFSLAPHPPKTEEFPAVCRFVLIIILLATFNIISTLHTLGLNKDG